MRIFSSLDGRKIPFENKSDLSFDTLNDVLNDNTTGYLVIVNDEPYEVSKETFDALQ